MESKINSKKSEIIIAAARNEFLQNGFAATSMEAIAEAAGIAKQTLYNHFTTKDELFAVALGSFIDQANALKLSKLSDPENIAQLRANLLIIASFIIRTLMNPSYLGFMKVILPSMTKHPRLKKIFRKTLPERILSAIGHQLDVANSAGLINIQSIDVTTRMFAGTFLTHVLLRGVLSPNATPQVLTRKEQAEIIDTFIELITRKS